MVISFFNQKGGVGKSTSAIQVASFMAKANKKVLLIDGDPQANATDFMLNATKAKGYLSDLINNEKELDEIITPALISKRDGAKPKEIGVDVLPISRASFAQEVAIDMFTNVVNQVRDRYDYIIFDCPPALNDMSVSILCATDKVFVPIECDINSATGSTELLETVNNIISEKLNEHLEIGGVFITKYVGRTKFAQYMYEQFVEQFGELLVSQPIRANTAVAESAYMGRPLAWFKTKSNAALDYENFANKIMEMR